MAPNQWGVFGTCEREDRRREVIETKLQSVSSKVTVRGFVAHVTATLLYHNDSGQNLQVECSFPIDEGAALYNFEAEIEDRKITAQCMEKKKAAKIYEEAVTSGHSAVYGSQDERTSDILHLTLGNFPAGTKAKLHLSFVIDLCVSSDGGVPFVLPAVLNPRYAPADHQSLGRNHRPNVDLTTIQLNANSAYSLSVEAEIMGGHGIARVISHTDALNVDLAEDGTTAKVTQDGGFKSDHDWSMKIYYLDPYKTHLVRETGDRSGTSIMKDDVLMVNLFPEVPGDSYSNKNEIIFIVDRSGSMAGGNMQSARATLLLFLKSLPNGCYFNIISFGNNHKALFTDGSREYNEESLSRAMQLHQEMKADMGGTEILRPLQYLYSQEPKRGYARQLILLTDGQVWNVDNVLKLVARHASDTRAFAVGIGEGASTALVKGIARAGRGQAEMVVQQDNLQTKVMGMLQKMVQESVHDVRVSAVIDPVSSIKMYPKVPPVIFGGSHLTLYMRLPQQTEVKAIHINGSVGSKPLLLSIDGSAIKVVHDESKALHRLAARAQVNQWQIDEEEDVSEEVIQLSLSSGVLSHLTAFVGVDNEGKTLKKERESDIYYDDIETDSMDCIPDSYTAQPTRRSKGFKRSANRENTGWATDSVCSVPNSSISYGMAPRCAPPPSRNLRASACAAPLFAAACAPPSPPCSFAASADCYDDAMSDEEEEEESCIQHQSQDDILLSLVSLQQFDGSWKMDDLKSFLGKQLEDVMKKNNTKNEACWATALVLGILETKCGELRQQWLLLANKARGFLTKEGVNVEELLKRAKEAL